MNNEAMNWLWSELEQQLGPVITAELQRGYRERLRAAHVDQQLDQYRQQLPGLRKQLAEAERHNKHSSVAGSLRYRISYRERAIQALDRRSSTTELQVAPPPCLP